MWKEFKEFILRGNVLDLAIAVIIGGAFGKIISSLVNDILMPPIGLLLGNVDFSNLFIDLSGSHYRILSEAQRDGIPTLNYGLFLNNVIDFLIVALVIFLALRAVNRLVRQEKAAEEPAAETKDCPFCLSAISEKATRCPFCTSKLKQ